MPEVAAEAQRVPRADRAHVAGLDVEGLGVEAQRQMAGRSGPRDSRLTASPSSRLVKNATRRPPFCVPGREVGQPRLAVDVEGPDAAVDDAFGAGHAAGEGDACRRRSAS